MHIISVVFEVLVITVGYWRQRADERFDNPPQGIQEPVVVRDGWKTPGGALFLRI